MRHHFPIFFVHLKIKDNRCALFLSALFTRFYIIGKSSLVYYYFIVVYRIVYIVGNLKIFKYFFNGKTPKTGVEFFIGQDGIIIDDFNIVMPLHFLEDIVKGHVPKDQFSFYPGSVNTCYYRSCGDATPFFGVASLKSRI